MRLTGAFHHWASDNDDRDTAPFGAQAEGANADAGAGALERVEKGQDVRVRRRLAIAGALGCRLLGGERCREERRQDERRRSHDG
jgi:hypothetical protein